MAGDTHETAKDQTGKDALRPAGDNKAAGVSPVKAAEKERLAAALRENLKRRKTQLKPRKSDTIAE